MTEEDRCNTPVRCDEVSHLLDFLIERDVPCPMCGYNLRNLTEPRCPECRQSLSLTVGSAEIRLRWFLAAITPGLFSGIAAAFLMIPIVIASVSGFGPPWDVIGIDAFGWTSGLVALGLMARRRTFLRQSSAVQRAIAIGLWAIHALVLALLLAGAP